MSIEERMESSKSYQSFRAGLDLGMGALYVVIGIFVIYAKYFGTVELPDTWAYVLGTLMILYGLFRVYRGFVAFTRKKERTHIRSAE